MLEPVEFVYDHRWRLTPNRPEADVTYNERRCGYMNCNVPREQHLLISRKQERRDVATGTTRGSDAD